MLNAVRFAGDDRDSLEEEVKIYAMLPESSPFSSPFFF
jgi:hypothetical protein